MRKPVVCAVSAAVMVVAGCTGGAPEADGPKKVAGADRLTFGAKPLWTNPVVSEDGEFGDTFGIDEVFAARLVGDYAVVTGHDDDGDLNDLELGSRAIVVADAETGEPVWSANETTPLADDELMKIVGVEAQLDIDIVDVGKQRAIVIGYEKYGNDDDEATDTEIGVAALALDDGELLWNIRAAKELAVTHDLNIAGANENSVLVSVAKNRNEHTTESKLLDVTTRKPSWTQDDAVALGLTDEVALLDETPPTDDGVDHDPSIQAVAAESGEDLWDSRDRYPGESEVAGLTDDLVIANTIEGGAALDVQTGKPFDLLKVDAAQDCATDDETFVVCGTAFRKLVTIPQSGENREFAKVPDGAYLTPAAAASGWIFINERDAKHGKYFAVDPAGNTMATPCPVVAVDNDRALCLTEKPGAGDPVLSVHTVQ